MNNDSDNNSKKKKREPNKWQLFLSECFTKQAKDIPFPEKVTACGAQYRELKERDPKKLDEIVSKVRNNQQTKTNN